MTRGQRFAAAGAALVLAFIAGGIAHAATAFSPPCTSDTRQCLDRRLDSVESWIKAQETPAPTPTVTTTTATPTPSSSTTTPVATTTSSTTTTATPTPTTTTVAPSTGWPDATNTGVPAGITLTPSGGLTITTAGTVIDGKDIAGTVQIRANNVTIRNSRITGSGYHIVTVDDGFTGARLENVEINGKGTSGTAGSNGLYGSATVIAANIHGVENGVVPSSGSVIRDSWIHNLKSGGDPHYDGIQIDGDRSNILLEHNLVDMRELGSTATVMIDNYFGPVDNVTVNNNRLLGGGWTVYVDGRFNSSPITRVTYSNNRIGYGQWGYASVDVYDPVWTGNVDDATGATIPQP